MYTTLNSLLEKICSRLTDLKCYIFNLNHKVFWNMNTLFLFSNRNLRVLFLVRKPNQDEIVASQNLVICVSRWPSMFVAWTVLMMYFCKVRKHYELTLAEGFSKCPHSTPALYK